MFLCSVKFNLSALFLKYRHSFEMRLLTKICMLLYISLKWHCMIWYAMLCLNTVTPYARRRISNEFQKQNFKTNWSSWQIFKVDFLTISKPAIYLNIWYTIQRYIKRNTKRLWFATLQMNECIKILNCLSIFSHSVTYADWL